jgi:hypothetical protein
VLEMRAANAFQNEKPRLGLQEETTQLVHKPCCRHGFDWNNEEIYRTPTCRPGASCSSAGDHGAVCGVVFLVLTVGVTIPGSRAVLVSLDIVQISQLSGKPAPQDGGKWQALRP